MVSTPLEVLRKGLKTLTDWVKTKKEELQARLAERKPIPAQDEHWLDHNANLVDEQWVLEVLESASFAHHVRSERSRALTTTHITYYFHT